MTPVGVHSEAHVQSALDLSVMPEFDINLFVQT